MAEIRSLFAGVDLSVLKEVELTKYDLNVVLCCSGDSASQIDLGAAVTDADAAVQRCFLVY